MFSIDGMKVSRSVSRLNFIEMNDECVTCSCFVVTLRGSAEGTQRCTAEMDRIHRIELILK